MPTRIALGVLTVLTVLLAPERRVAAGPLVQPDAAVEAPVVETPVIAWRWSAGAAYQFDADIDDGGEFGLTRWSTGVGAAFDLSPTLKLDVGVGYEFDGYDFSGSTGFGGLDPWDDVHSLRFRARFMHIIDRQWALFGGPILGVSYEDGAGTGDAFTGGGIVGANYRASEDFSIGFGVGAFSKLEDDAAVFPFFTLNWRAADGVTVTSGNFDLGSSGGQGLEVVWDMTDAWKLGVGVQYQSRRFRLDDRGIAPDGVGQETAIPVYVKSTWTLAPNATVSVFGGVVAGGELLLEDRRGGRVSEQDFDPVPVVGGRVSIRF